MTLEDRELTLAAVSQADRPVLRRLLELYQYETSRYDGTDISDGGTYGYRYLDHYWTEEGRHAFFIRADGRLAGFALVRRLSDGPPPLYSMAEFFVMAKYQGRGIGGKVAHRMFDRFPGIWRVSETPGNVPAQAFWRRVIGEYTGGRFKEWRNPPGHRYSGYLVQEFLAHEPQDRPSL